MKIIGLVKNWLKSYQYVYHVVELNNGFTTRRVGIHVFQASNLSGRLRARV